MTSAEAMAIAIEWADGSRTHRRPVVRDLADQARAYAAQAGQDAAEVRKWTTLAVALAQIEEIRRREWADAVCERMNRPHEALERIASQGKGHYDATAHDIVSDDGSGRPWVHWATIAEDALARYRHALPGQRTTERTTMMIDAFKLAMLPRDKTLTIFENANGFTCIIAGCPKEAWAYRVKLPERAGLACPGCAQDHGFTVR